MLSSVLTACLLLAPGQRPYELDWAGRTTDAYPVLAAPEQMVGWTVEPTNAVARVEASDEQRLWGDTSAKVTYRGTGGRASVMLRPPRPLACPPGFDTVTLWAAGNNWGWAPDPKTPQVALLAHFAGRGGATFAVRLWQVDWREWNLLHRKLTPAQAELARDGATFTGLEIAGGTNRDDRSLWLDHLGAFREVLAPLSFKPRPRRALDPFPGQDPGINTGAGRLPFPTRPETILPPVAAPDGATSVGAVPGAFQLTWRGAGGTLVWSITEELGDWSDVTVTLDGGPRVQPLVGGGIVPVGGRPVKTRKLLSAAIDGPAVVMRWRLDDLEVTYTYRLWGKSLVIDTRATGGGAGEVRYGRAVGLAAPRLVQVPYYVYSPGRPLVAVSGTAARPLFLAGNTCWYTSNASELFGVAGNGGAADADSVVYNGGARYHPRTDGRRNDVCERFFVTLARRFDEVLPVVANPPSPWREVTGTGVWLAHGASNRESDAAHFRNFKRHGLDKLIITDHETMWRDGGESFTFRTRTAPGRGGDESARRYSRLLQDELGYVYGPYNNFTDFAPVNGFWDTDRVARGSDGNLQHAWMRCYAPKPVWAVSMCEQLAPEIQRKFGFSTAYCDVHTAIPPWGRTDYDARVPGAGTFAATFYAWGEILLLQRAAWGGPVYSEGNHHVFLHGLTDGNYAQDQHARLPDNPWLVDFDLLRLHDLGCNFGMGDPSMFYGAGAERPADPDVALDRFLAATVAFGHPGFLVRAGGMRHPLRSYFLLQGLASAYTRQSVASIRYVAADGSLQDTSTAVAAGTIARCQVVNTYADGLVTVVNGHREERLRARVAGRELDLPPNGFAAWRPGGGLEVLCGDASGHRYDYAETPGYLYLDGRGHFARPARAGGAGQAACVRRGAGEWELIPLANAESGWDLGGTVSAVALDKERRALGSAEVRHARGLAWVMPVTGAFSYRLTVAGAAPTGPTSARIVVTPGERVPIPGDEAFTVPADARPGQHLWHRAAAGWLDFQVVAVADLRAELDGNRLRVRLTSHLPTPTPAQVTLPGAQPTLLLTPEREATVPTDLPAPRAEGDEPLAVGVKLGTTSVEGRWTLRTVRGYQSLGPLPRGYTGGMAYRGQPETTVGAALQAAGVHVEAQGALSCGAERKHRPGTLMLFMHPPWIGGVGYCFALTEPLDLPAGPPLALRALVGKRDGSDLGDGITFRVAVVDAALQTTVVGEQTVKRHEWLPIEGDLSRWTGQRIRLKLIADVGPADNSSGDWACWADVRVESREQVLTRTLIGG